MNESENLLSFNEPAVESGENVSVEIDDDGSAETATSESDPRNDPENAKVAALSNKTEEGLTYKQNLDKQRQKNKNPFKERISHLTNSNKALQAQLAEKERILALREKELQSKNSINEKLYNSSLSAQEQGIVHQLRAAKEDGDIDKEIHLQQELARVKSEQATFGLYKNQYQQQQTAPAYTESVDTDFEDQEYQQSPYAQSHSTQVENIPEATLNFLERNPWADQNSSLFDQDLWTEINEAARDLNKRLKFNNQSDLIGTDAYYESLEKYMNAQYGLNQTSPQDIEEPAMQQQSRPASKVGGVNRAGASMADQYAVKSSNSKPVMTLTPAEYRIARNLQIPHPSGNGSYLSSEEAIKKYAEKKAFYSRQAHDPRFSVRM